MNKFHKTWKNRTMSIKFNIDMDKTIEVILWLSNKKHNITYHTLLKLLFYAEEYHLNKFGRPIIGDRYVAMKFGPVASMTYDLIQKNAKRKEITSIINKLPFDNPDKTVIPYREANTYYLSQSDIEALEYSFETYKDYKFDDFCDSTHEHMAWKNARNRFTISNNPPMNYKDFFTPENADRIEELSIISEHLIL